MGGIAHWQGLKKKEGLVPATPTAMALTAKSSQVKNQWPRKRISLLARHCEPGDVGNSYLDSTPFDIEINTFIGVY